MRICYQLISCVLYFIGHSLKGHGLKKVDAMNLLFYIYCPPATGLKNTRQSTWMNPIVDGVEAKKLLGKLEI